MSRNSGMLCKIKRKKMPPKNFFFTAPRSLELSAHTVAGSGVHRLGPTRKISGWTRSRPGPDRVDNNDPWTDGTINTNLRLRVKTDSLIISTSQEESPAICLKLRENGIVGNLPKVHVGNLPKEI